MTGSSKLSSKNALFSPVFKTAPVVVKVARDSQDDRIVLHCRVVQMAAFCSAASQEFNCKIPTEYHLTFCDCVIIELLPEPIDIVHKPNSPLKLMAEQGLVWFIEKQIKGRRFDKCVGNNGVIIPVVQCKNERMKKDRVKCLL